MFYQQNADVMGIIRKSGLPEPVKTSGSSGIHLVVPLARKTTYDTSLSLGTRITRAVVAHRPT